MSNSAELNFINIPNLMAACDACLQGVAGGVVAIGNFDGVHKGHRIVLDTARNLASINGHAIPAVAMTFEPHPRTVFNPSSPVFRLSPPEIKSRLFQAVGLNGQVVIPFDHAFSQMPAEDFVRDLVVGRLKATHVVVGYDFHFGKARAGTPEFLIEKGKHYGFAVSVVPAQKETNGALVYSSTAVRQYLAKGDIVAANKILGYRYFVTGPIIHGEKRGRDLGYPTANMVLAPQNQLRHGIYAVQMRVDGACHGGVASFGRRPTFDNGAPLLETFVFDFSGDLYGKTVEVILVQFLRDEEKFETIGALVAQMAQDSLDARAALVAAGDGTKIDEALNNIAV